MDKLKRLAVFFLALILTVSVVSTSFADRKRKTKVKKKKTVTEKKVSREDVTEKSVIFGFEDYIEGWGIPDWAQEKEEYVAEEICMSGEYASEGESSLEVKADFPGKKWTAAYLEYTEDFDWVDAREVAVDIYVPKGTPVGLKGKIILAVGDDWKWTEMRRSILLVPGKWVTVKANLMPGSSDWKRVKPDDEFRMSVHRLGIRIESDKKPTYKGSIYIDNIRLAVAESKKAMKKPTEDSVIFGFEDYIEGWKVPDWAQEKEEYVAEEICMSGEYASEGESSLEVKADFPGKKWTSAYVEYTEDFYWVNGLEIAADIYIPKGTPSGLKGKIILAVGDDWKWTEMRRGVLLVPGKWVTVKANLMPGTTDWKGIKSDDDFRMSVHRLGIRIESDKKPAYKGSIYVDNIRLAVAESKKAMKKPTEDSIIFDFEDYIEKWKIPDWARDSDDYVAEEICMSGKYASEGKNSLEVKADFPGKKWTGAYVEYMENFDWTDGLEIAADIYIPKGTPSGLKGKIILAVGDDWKWTEMRRDVLLVPGKWVTVKANLMPGSIDWKGVEPDDKFRMGIRKLGVRVESNRKPTYEGSIYIDNIRLTVLEK